MGGFGRRVFALEHRDGGVLQVAPTGMSSIQVFSRWHRRKYQHCYAAAFGQRLAEFLEGGVQEAPGVV